MRKPTMRLLNRSHKNRPVQVQKMARACAKCWFSHDVAHLENVLPKTPLKSIFLMLKINFGCTYTGYDVSTVVCCRI